MRTYRFLFVIFICFCFSKSLLFSNYINEESWIDPNNFEGSDSERIEKAIQEATEKNSYVRISRNKNRLSDLWIIDNAILLPSEMTIILDNVTLQLSDRSRDNLFRSKNVGLGITEPVTLNNISIIGVGKSIIKGAINPRSTGDGFRRLVLDPKEVQEKGEWRVSYGSDASDPNQKQYGDWRNILVLFAYVDGLEIKNLKIMNSHGWAISMERVLNGNIENIEFFNPEKMNIGEREVSVFNRDGINLRHGCKFIRIHNIHGITGDDFIALSALDLDPKIDKYNGDINSTMVTASRYFDSRDDIEYIYITNITSSYTGVGIRASGGSKIHHVFIDGIYSIEHPIIKRPYGGGSPYALLVGGKGYGDNSNIDISNIFASNIFGNGKRLVWSQVPINNCHFNNCTYLGHSDIPEIIIDEDVLPLIKDVYYNNVPLK